MKSNPISVVDWFRKKYGFIYWLENDGPYHFNLFIRTGKRSKMLDFRIYNHWNGANYNEIILKFLKYFRCINEE